MDVNYTVYSSLCQLELLKQQNTQIQDQLSSETQRLRQQIEELKLNAVQRQASLQEEQGTLTEQLDITVRENSNALMSDKDKELEMLRNEIAALRGENAMTKTLKSAVTSLEEDKAELLERVKSLEQKLELRHTHSGQQSSTEDTTVEQLREEKEFAEGQINFLNSVIVDLQRKNEELKVKLKKMALTEFNGNEDNDGLVEVKKKKKAPPRVFCDICDCFDLHDTEDCPTQTQSPDSPPHSSYRGRRSDERPYCDICEAFGHATESCNDDQTF